MQQLYPQQFNMLSTPDEARGRKRGLCRSCPLIVVETIMRKCSGQSWLASFLGEGCVRAYYWSPTQNLGWGFANDVLRQRNLNFDQGFRKQINIALEQNPRAADIYNCALLPFGLASFAEAHRRLDRISGCAGHIVQRIVADVVRIHRLRLNDCISCFCSA